MLFWHLGLTVAIVFFTLGRRSIDYRVVMLGAILPDLLDKPIGTLLLRDRFQNGRIYGHTLLFSLVLVLGIQSILRGRSARRWFVLPIACLIHLGLDSMWNDPVTLFWPLFGTKFPITIEPNYWWEVWLRPFRHPVYAVQEFLGLGLLIYFAFAFGLFHRDRLRAFMRDGIVTEKAIAPRSAGQGGRE